MLQLPCAHSVFVVHVQGAEAKIEDCFSSFMAVEEVQQERPSQRGNYILYDSDDNYLVRRPPPPTPVSLLDSCMLKAPGW